MHLDFRLSLNGGRDVIGVLEADVFRNTKSDKAGRRVTDGNKTALYLGELVFSSVEILKKH